MPPPTTTHSADSRAPVEAGASAAPPATAAQRTLSPRWRSRAGIRVPLSSGDAAVAMAVAVAATISGGVAELSACAAEWMTRRDGVGPLGLELRMAHWNVTGGLGIAFPCVIGSVNIQSLSKSTQDLLRLTGHG